MKTASPRRIEPSTGVPHTHILRHQPPLDLQIAAAEHAVIDRDQRVQLRARQVADRLVANWPLTLGLTLAAAFLLGRMLAPRPHADSAAPSPTRAALAPEAPLWRILPLLWTLAPDRLRAKLPSGKVALLTNVATTLFGGVKPRPRA